jgi:hypothetical protein
MLDPDSRISGLLFGTERCPATSNAQTRASLDSVLRNQNPTWRDTLAGLVFPDAIIHSASISLRRQVRIPCDMLPTKIKRGSKWASRFYNQQPKSHEGLGK